MHLAEARWAAASSGPIPVLFSGIPARRAGDERPPHVPSRVRGFPPSALWSLSSARAGTRKMEQGGEWAAVGGGQPEAVIPLFKTRSGKVGQEGSFKERVRAHLAPSQPAGRTEAEHGSCTWSSRCRDTWGRTATLVISPARCLLVCLMVPRQRQEAGPPRRRRQRRPEQEDRTSPQPHG